ncbi:hypothetical protein NMY22_g9520 [Coprinellus aureogranulatus]|nr:hypothetical protein NMY22_g9520 [Coprinellus aureogranulatus]
MSRKGVRRLTPQAYTAHTTTILPDVVTALTDTPFTPPPFSQKRITKSIERSTAWLAQLLASPSPSAPSASQAVSFTSTSTTAPETGYRPPFAVLAPLAGLTSPAARRAFAASLLESLDNGMYISGIPGLPNVNLGRTRGQDGGRVGRLDDGVSGYTVDLVPIQKVLESSKSSKEPRDGREEREEREEGKGDGEREVESLLRASLEVLPEEKVRLVNGVEGPHDVLRLIQTVGVDMFDAGWAQKCADVGVALDFTFPAPPPSPSPSSPPSTTPSLSPASPPVLPEDGNKGKRQLGRNLYDAIYAEDFSKLSEEGGRCGCGACRPRRVERRLYHGVDTPEWSGEGPYPAESPRAADVVESGIETGKEEPSGGFTRAYVHHLLHTHEMSAHTLLVMHNLSVVERFFHGIRSVLSSSSSSSSSLSSSTFEQEVKKFVETYDEEWAVRKEAENQWGEVDRARGKGRLAREREVTKDAGEVGVDP